MSEINLEKLKNIYFIGIGGIGMSAVARMFLLEGKKVSGSDLSDSEIISELQKLGAEIYVGAPTAKLPEGIDLVIYTVAIPDTHPELTDARAKKIPTISYPEALGIISKDKFTIAVAGTHGKTTTTAMIAQILMEAGLDPTVIVGSLLKGFKSNFIAGKSKYFVVEACEYKRSFLNLRPDIAVITNIDDDHLDYYKNLAGIQGGFRDFVNVVKPGGTIVTDTEHTTIKPVVAGLFKKISNYNSASEFSGEAGGKISLKVPGLHNIQNAKAALTVAHLIGIPYEKALEAVQKFSGTWRRFEEKGKTQTGALVYDDYAHHPSEIKATLQGAREKFPGQKIVVAFQPHLYSRTKEHIEEFAPAFADADEIILLPIYAAREPKDDSVSSDLLAEKMINAGLHTSFFADLKLAADFLKDHLKTGDVFFTMGAGDINKLGELILK